MNNVLPLPHSVLVYNFLGHSKIFCPLSRKSVQCFDFTNLPLNSKTTIVHRHEKERVILEIVLFESKIIKCIVPLKIWSYEGPTNWDEECDFIFCPPLLKIRMIYFFL